MDDKEREEKAKNFADKMEALAETTAQAFEQWLAENQNASKAEAHEKLVDTIKMNTIMNLMGLMFM